MLLKVNDDNLLASTQKKVTQQHLTMNATGGNFNLSNNMYRESTLLSFTAEANQKDRTVEVVMGGPGPR